MTMKRRTLILMMSALISLGLPHFCFGQQGSAREERRQYASSHPGDPLKGQKLFSSPKLACAMCHTITEKEKSGPNFEGIGDKYSRAELIRAIEDPSYFINPGYETTVIETIKGKVYIGVLKRVTSVDFRLLDVAGKRRKILRSDIREQSVLQTSLMPEGLVAGLTPKEFTDLIAYLEIVRL